MLTAEAINRDLLLLAYEGTTLR